MRVPVQSIMNYQICENTLAKRSNGFLNNKIKALYVLKVFLVSPLL